MIQGAIQLSGFPVFKLMGGVQESLAGRAAVLSLTSLSQAEICGGTTEPFTVDMEALMARKEGGLKADVGDIYERIYRGSMPAIVSGANSSSQMLNVAEIARNAGPMR